MLFHARVSRRVSAVATLDPRAHRILSEVYGDRGARWAALSADKRNAEGTVYTPGIGPGSIAALHSVADVRVVTSPIHGDAWYFERAEWCKIHLGVIPKHVIHKSEKETEHGDYLLDDKPAHVAAWAKAHPKGMGLLWSQPYNQRHVFPGWLENVRRVYTWAEVEQLVRAHDGG